MRISDWSSDVCSSDLVVMIRGSGVDLAAYPPVAEPPPPVVALMVARLLRDKGVLEFVEAARLLRRQGAGVRMLLAGGIDRGNPASVTQADVDGRSEEHASELQSLMRISYAVYCLNKKKTLHTP